MSFCKTIHKPFYIHNENRVQDQRLEVGGVLLQMIHTLHGYKGQDEKLEDGNVMKKDPQAILYIYTHTLTRGKKLNKSLRTLKP